MFIMGVKDILSCRKKSKWFQTKKKHKRDERRETVGRKGRRKKEEGEEVTSSNGHRDSLRFSLEIRLDLVFLLLWKTQRNRKRKKINAINY